MWEIEYGLKPPKAALGPGQDFPRNPLVGCDREGGPHTRAVVTVSRQDRVVWLIDLVVDLWSHTYTSLSEEGVVGG